MDLISFAGPPMLGAIFGWLVNTGAAVVSRRTKASKLEPINAPKSDVLRGQLGELRMDPAFTGMSRIFEELEFLQSNYEESGPFDSGDEGLVASLSRLREHLEVLFGQRITFQGEDGRPVSGSKIGVGQVINDAVEDKIVGAKGRMPSGGTVHQEINRSFRTEIVGFDGSGE